MSRNAEPRRRTPSRVSALALVGALGLAAALVPALPAAADDVFALLVDQDSQPVVGLEVLVSEVSSGDSWLVTSGPVGAIELTDVPSGDYTVTPTDDLDQTDHGYVQVASASFSTSAPGSVVTLERYGNVVGSLDSWNPAFVRAELDVWYLDPGTMTWGFTGITGVTTTGIFAIPAVRDAGLYTVGVYLDPLATAPYLDGFYGSTDEADTGVPALAGGDITALDVALRDAALIQGRVTTLGGSQPVAGIQLSAEQQDAPNFTAFASSDANGYYTLRVLEGGDYAVFADDTSAIPVYASEAYQDRDPCSCSGSYDFVAPTATTAATGIDIELEVAIAGGVGIGGSGAYSGLAIHVYRAVPGGWVEVRVALADSVGEFDAVITRAGSYRLRFSDSGTWVGFDSAVGGGPLTSSPESFTAACHLDTGEIDPAAALLGLAYLAFLDFADPSSTDCGPEPALPGTGGPGGGTATRPTGSKAGSAGGVQISDPAVTATPTPTSSATPRPTAAPTPEATAPAEPAPASAPDLWWLLWVGLGLLVVIVVGGVVFFLRRT